MLEEDGAMDADHLVGEEPGSPPQPRGGEGALAATVLEPVRWVRMLCRELGGTFVAGVVLVYGLSQGFAGSFFRVASDYYWKDVQRVQPATVQFLSVFFYVPWVLKPLWGVMTDVFPVHGYRRRPYFLFSATIVAMATGLPVSSAVLCFVGISTAVAIADVTIDACIAKNSIDKPALAPDMQSLCAFSSSLGALIGYATSGMFVHHLGAQGALGVMAIPPATVVFLGFFIYELKTYHHNNVKEKVLNKVSGAVKGMVRTIKYPVVWKPSLYMFLSLALSISTHEGQFYWYTSKTPPNPGFSQEFVGLVHAIGAVASMVGVLIYHKCLKNYPFRSILFYAQLLYGVSGLLDLTFVLRWNLALGVPDAVFVTLEECVSRVVGRVRLMPMMVLSTKLCPPGVEGTFFALLMCIDSLGMLTAKAGGAAVLRALHVTRTDFGHLWLAVLLRNVLRLATLGAIFLVPTADQTDVLVPRELLTSSPAAVADDEEERLQLAMLTSHTDDV
ncbi:putative folate-biopterin transporter 6 [Dichanthelium oligosanthes]|uniref:Putative folate-biopterin transporter 6 n=1 Tax=Dichanthelium oligosanthes TaxID=888268 RepID=A0A1E5V9E7_9POAL|nr:putative folate-biopterin transporter 6 [Dichanthelium oligosanthes]